MINDSMRDLERSYDLAADQLSLCVRARLEHIKA